MKGNPTKNPRIFGLGFYSIYFASTESATGASSIAALSTKVESVVTSGEVVSSVEGEEQAVKIKIELRMNKVFFIFLFNCLFFV